MSTADAPARSGPGLTRWRNSVIAAFGIGGIAISTWGPRLPAIKDQLGIDTGAIGLLLAATTIGSIAGLLLSTATLHVLGNRRAVGGAVVLVGASLVLMAAALQFRSVPLLAVAFVIVGYGLGTVDVLINVEGSAVERLANRTLMPLMHAAWSIGAAVGSGIGALCAGIGLSPAGQFAIEGLLIAIAGGVIGSGIPAGVREEEHDGPVPSRRERVAAWARGWLDVRLLLIGVVMLGAELSEGSANSWLTLATREDHGQTAAVAALFFTAFAIGEASTRILAGPLVDRFGRIRITRITMAIGVVGLVLFILGGPWWLVLLGVLAWSVGVSMGFPLGMSAAAESGPNPAARLSVVASIGYFSSLAGPPTIGLLAEHTGLLGALWVLVIFMAFGLAAAGSLGARRAAVAHDSLEG